MMGTSGYYTRVTDIGGNLLWVSKVIRKYSRIMEWAGASESRNLDSIPSSATN